MKRLYKKSVLILCSLSFAGFVFAQNIELPEVTTVISGETEKAEADALPDFSDVLSTKPVSAGSGGVEPVLPEVETTENTEIATGKTIVTDKSVYAEGLLGGGYPTLFKGDIAVFRNVGESPFRFALSHDSAAGYAGHSFTDGFSDRLTKIEIEKSYKKDNFTWSAGGSYQTAADGLQGNVTSVMADEYPASLFNHDTYNAEGKIGYEFSNGFYTGFDAGVDFYNRYADRKSTCIPTIAYMDLEPSAYFRWKGHGFDTGITAAYSLGTEFASDSFGTGHRAEFSADLQWQNDVLRVFGSASAVVGNHLNDKPVIVPFSVGIDSSFPVYFANRRVGLALEGGIKSYKPHIWQLENQYKFSEINFTATETSDWYGKFNLTLPLKSAFTGNAVIEYYQTAYDNGVWEADYSDETTNLYFINQKDHQLLITDFSLAYTYEIFSISGGWHSNWMDVPALESKQSVRLALNLQDEQVRWGATLGFIMLINSEIESPVVNAEGFVRITPSVRAILSVNDLIKLYQGETRVYAGKYASRGGSATVLLKFIF